MAEIDLGRVKRNVSKMVSMDATEGEIDTYLSSEGATVDQVRSYRLEPKLSEDEAKDLKVYEQFSNGVYRGIPIIGGALDEVGAAADGAVDAVFKGKNFGESYDRSLKLRRMANKNYDDANPIKSTVEKVGGAVASAPAIPFARVFHGNGMLTGAANATLNAVPVAMGSAFTEGEGGLGNRVEAAKDALPAAATTAFLAGGAAQGLANRLSGTPQVSIARQANNIGLEVPSFMEGGRGVQSIAAKMGGIPFVGDDLNNAVFNLRRNVGDTADNISNVVSNGVHVQQAGENARAAMNDWATDGARAVQDRVYAPVNAAMQNAVSPLNNARQAAQELARQEGVSASPIHGRALAEVGNALNQPNGLSFEGITRLRTRIGAMIDNTLDPENRTAVSGLRAIYAGLTRDMEDTIAQQGGPAVRRLWDRANRVTQQIAERRDTVARIIGSHGDKTGEGVVDKIMVMASTKSTADAARLATARRVIGQDAWNEVAGNIIMRLGRNQANEFSPDIFLKNYRQLSDRGRQLLFRSTNGGDLAQALDNMAAVSDRLQRFSKMGNPSGSGGVAALLAAMGGAASGDMGATLGTAVAGRSVGLLMSRPAVVRNATVYARNVANHLNGRASKATVVASAVELAKVISEATGEDEKEVMARLDSVTAGQIGGQETPAK